MPYVERYLLLWVATIAAPTAGAIERAAFLAPIDQARFAVYHLEKEAWVDVYEIDAAEPVTTIELSFPDEDLFFEKTSATGKTSVIPRYELLGLTDEHLYFRDGTTKKLAMVQRQSGEITSMILRFPTYPRQIIRWGEGLLVIAEGIVPTPRGPRCINAHFVTLDKEGNTGACWGEDERSPSDFDLAYPFISPDGVHATVYYRLSGKLMRYNTSTGEKTKETTMDKSVVEQHQPGISPEFVSETGDGVFLVKLTESACGIYQARGDRWESVREIDGTFEQGSVIGDHVVLVGNGGLVREKID